ncbi:MAG: hypothetical protein BroJett013_30600 [Alphaproteobacteria bacterium]|nr:MAG: hypothetical protein BroJett013_30600 [Alphaproteobacteria bacterium]
MARASDRACLTPVQMAVGRLFSDEEIEDALARLAARYARLKAGQGVLSDADPFLWREAFETLAAEDLREGLIEARMRAAAAVAKARRQNRYDGHDGNAGAKLRALLVGEENRGDRRGLSIDAEGKALEARAQSDFAQRLDEVGQLERLADPFKAFAPDTAFEDKVAMEIARLNGEERAQTGDADALKVAEIIKADQDRARAAMNRLGAWIGELPGYISRTTHDAIKISGGFWKGMNETARAEARAAWIRFIRPLLDERTFVDSDEFALRALQDEIDRAVTAAGGGKAEVDALMRERALAVIEASRQAFLERVWTDIVSGYRASAGEVRPDDLDGFAPPPSLARKLSRSRVLHFADAEAWIAYNRRFGSGSLFQAHLSFLSRASRAEALMRNFGPSPEAAFKADRERLAAEARADGDVAGVKAVQSLLRQAEFDQLTGAAEMAENHRLATSSRAIRSWTQMAKLGGMIFSSVTDLGNGAQALARAGVGRLKSYQQLVQSIADMPDGVVRDEVANLVGEGARVMAGDIAARFTAPDANLGTMFKLQRVFYRVNAFHFWAARIRRGAAHILARHLGARAEQGWGALDEATRAGLERYGVDAGVWELVRGQAAEIDGARILTPDAVERLDDQAVAAWTGKKAPSALDIADARRELMIRLQAYFTDTIDTVMTEPRARERAMLRLGTRTGTVLGTALELFMQFKSFPLSMLTRHLGPAFADAQRGAWGQFAHLLSATTALGFVAMTLKDLARGLKPQPLEDEDGNPNLDVFLRAFVQGGGAGLYADFIFGDYDRFGRSPFAALAGPSVGELERLLRIFTQLREGNVGEAGAGAARVAIDNTPFLNLFYTRIALNYLFLYQLQEEISPGYLERMEQSTRESRGGQEYYYPPSEMIGP